MISMRRVMKWYGEYQAGASLNALARKYGRSRRAFSEMFQRRGLELRPRTMPPRGKDGRIIPVKRHTWAEIDAIMAGEKRLRIPVVLRREWRLWSMRKRAKFAERYKGKIVGPRPETPFSENVEPFQFGTDWAHALIAEVNAGRCSREFVSKINVCSQGVEWRGSLWFWSKKGMGYFRMGGWTAEGGRPALHHAIWEHANGRPVPEECVVRFIDGNQNNLAPENLQLVTRNEVCRENQAKVLFEKSREQLATVLSLSERKEDEHADLVTGLLKAS